MSKTATDVMIERQKGEIERRKIEENYVGRVREWSGRMVAWTLRMKALREEREALESEIVALTAETAMALLKDGIGSLTKAEERAEQLLEQAFRPERREG